MRMLHRQFGRESRCGIGGGEGGREMKSCQVAKTVPEKRGEREANFPVPRSYKFGYAAIFFPRP